MLFVRRFEERVAEMYLRAKIGGYCHLNIGEEATVVGTLKALRDDDYFFGSYREHGFAIVRDVPAGAVMAELFGKRDGCARGRGGSMHLVDPDRRFMGGYGIVGGSIPLSTGVAFAIKYRDSDEVVMSVFGDGATNIGGFPRGAQHGLAVETAEPLHLHEQPIRHGHQRCARLCGDRAMEERRGLRHSRAIK